GDRRLCRVRRVARQGRRVRDPGHRRRARARGPRVGDQRDRAAARRGAGGGARARGAGGLPGAWSRTVTIADNWQAVRARVDDACKQAGRDPGEVTIVAVSKTHPASAVIEAAAAGATDFGENYAQELVEKMAAVTNVRWHFIGRLQ